MNDKLGERQEGGPSNGQDVDSAFRKVAEWYGSGPTEPHRGRETPSRERGPYALRIDRASLTWAVIVPAVIGCVPVAAALAISPLLYGPYGRCGEPGGLPLVVAVPLAGLAAGVIGVWKHAPFTMVLLSNGIAQAVPLWIALGFDVALTTVVFVGLPPLWLTYMLSRALQPSTAGGVLLALLALAVCIVYLGLLLLTVSLAASEWCGPII